MLRLLLTLALGALLALPGPEAMAIGFGRVGNATVLGQGLNFTVAVRLEGDEALSAECVTAEVFSGENRLPSTAVRIAIEPGADPAERTLRVSSNAVIDEPVIGVNLQLTCPNRLARKFVVFVDPPSMDLARAVPAVAASAAPPSRGETANKRTVVASAPAAAAAAGDAPVAKAATKPAQRPRRAAAASTGAAPRVVVLTAAAQTPSSGTRKNVAPAKPLRAPAGAGGVRLELQAADHAPTREHLNPRVGSSLESPVMTAVVAAPLVDAPVAPAVEDDTAVRAREREHMLALEDSLAKLRAESKATQASLAQIQLRLIEAERERPANALVYGLAALAAALAVALGAVLWRREGARRTGPAWWASPTPSAAAALTAAAEAHDDDWGAAERIQSPALRRPENAEPAMAETTASPMLLSEVHTLANLAAEESLRGVEPAHEMSVEELMDLEQQAEFFIVLGQEEAAIDLLMGHLRSSGGASPLPYLKLLEIYRRRNEREAFERIRERFNRRFNAYAPDWQADPQQGRPLLDYTAAVERLQSLWGRPAQAMQALEASLFRRDGGNATFDLPAYRELLLLYAVARDLSEREAPPAGVDLLLPLGGDVPEAESMTRLHPSAAAALSMERTTLVDLDIASLDAGPSQNDDRPSRFHTDFSPTSGYMGLPGESRPSLA